MTRKQFIALLAEIEKNHWLINGKCVKYVDSSFDFRTKTFWRVVIRPFGKEKVFMPADLDKIMKWLNE